VVFEVLGDRLKQEGQAGHEPLTRETHSEPQQARRRRRRRRRWCRWQGAGQVRHRAARLRVDAIAERAIDP
jgi:hypothetical protein